MSDIPRSSADTNAGKEEVVEEIDIEERITQYISWGFIPLPLVVGEKRPYGAGWQRTLMSQSRGRIRMAIENQGTRKINLGVLCGHSSGIIVLDIDSKNGGMERWKRATDKFGVPVTFTVATGGGGLHLYFRYDSAPASLKTAANALGPGWDIRSDNGQVVGPFSIHPTTEKRYMPIMGYDAETDRPTIGDMPRWIHDPYSD